MLVGWFWYGPLFGRKWMEIIGAPEMDEAAQKAMQKEATSLYAIQFILVLLQLYVLSHYIKGWEVSGIENALWIWLGFVVPTLAAAAMWNNDPNRIKLARFGIQAGYQLVIFVIFGFIISTWG
jgi:hypothetical protein